MGEYILLFALLGGGGFVHSGGSELEGEGGGRKWSAGAIRSEFVVRTGEGRSMCRICGKIYSKSSPAILHVLVKVIKSTLKRLCITGGKYIVGTYLGSELRNFSLAAYKRLQTAYRLVNFFCGTKFKSIFPLP